MFASRKELRGSCTSLKLQVQINPCGSCDAGNNFKTWYNEFISQKFLQTQILKKFCIKCSHQFSSNCSIIFCVNFTSLYDCLNAFHWHSPNSSYGATLSISCVSGHLANLSPIFSVWFAPFLVSTYSWGELSDSLASKCSSMLTS